jgi:hypothetical protein
MAEIVNLDDIGMAQLGYRRRFFLKSAHEFLVARQMGMDDFHGHHAPQIGIGRFVNGRHAALSQQSLNLVASPNRPSDPAWFTHPQSPD